MSSAFSDDARALVRRFAALPLRAEGGVRDLDAAGDIVEALFESLGHEDLGELTATEIDAGGLSLAAGIELLGISMWGGETNGAQLSATLERWLMDADDEVRVALALGQSVFPFRDAATMTRVLDALSARFPAMAARCHALIKQRRDQGV